MREESYRVPRRREERRLAEEVSKFSLCFALSEYRRALGSKGRNKVFSGMDVPGIKAGILADSIRAGDEVEGEALASTFAAIYQPRAYYPAYVLGEMRAALRRGEDPPPASPHYLPVNELPPLPDDTRIVFLYQQDKTAFDRPDFPAHVRDVFTRDFMRLPLLVPPQQQVPRGRVRFRAHALRMDRDSAYRLAGLGENSFDAYSARGLTYFLQPVEVETVDAKSSLRGSFFCELSFDADEAWERMVQVLEETVQAEVERVFPPCPRGEREEMGCYLPQSGFHITRFRRKFYALVYDPVIVILRAPRLMGIYLPGELASGGEETRALFDEFVLGLITSLERQLSLASPPGVETAYDNLLPWARERGALRGPAFASLQDDHPFLKPTLGWLRGDLDVF